MRKTVPMSFGELWEDFLSATPRVGRRVDEIRVSELWQQVVEPAIVSMTESVNLVNGVMYVKIVSSAARHLVFQRREELRLAVNARAGREAVKVLIVK